MEESSQSQRNQEAEQVAFCAKMANAKNMAIILKSLHFKDVATFFITENGLKVTVEDCKCIQANAYLKRTLFDDFEFNEESLVFKLNMNVLMDCLTIFGSSATNVGVTTSLEIRYAGYGFPLQIILEENGVITECSIKTLESDEILDFEFCNNEVVNKIIMKSEFMKEAFSEIDVSSELLEIVMSPEPPYFKLSTYSSFGSTHIEYPKDSDMVEVFQCAETTKNKYRTALLKPSYKALALSSKVSVRTDNRGILSIQYMIRTDDGQNCFIEFFCSPEEEVDDPYGIGDEQEPNVPRE